MVSITDYRETWDDIARRCGISESMAITTDKEMAKRIQRLQKGQPVLFWLPPAAKSDGNSLDNFREKNSCVVFVMEKYDPQQELSISVLERTQKKVERVKACLIDMAATPCSHISIDPGSLDTLPESEFYGSLAGWSIGFRIITDYFSHE